MLLKVFLLFFFFLCLGIHFLLADCVVHFAVMELGSPLSYPSRHIRTLHNEGTVHVSPVAFAAEQNSHPAMTICFMNKKAAFQFFWSSPTLSSSEMHYCPFFFQFGKHLDFYTH